MTSDKTETAFKEGAPFPIKIAPGKPHTIVVEREVLPPAAPLI